jgi:hypothetical protein
MVAEDTAFGAPAAGKEQPPSMIGLRVFELFFQAFKMPTMTTCQSYSFFLAAIKRR